MLYFVGLFVKVFGSFFDHFSVYYMPSDLEQDTS